MYPVGEIHELLALDSLIKSENDSVNCRGAACCALEVQETRLLPGDLGVSPSFSKSPNVWGI